MRGRLDVVERERQGQMAILVEEGNNPWCAVGTALAGFGSHVIR
jgi:hypothetical protein